jgi:hypothetical protein
VRVDASAYLADLPHRRVRRPVELALTAHSYAVELPAETSWLAVAIRAFRQLARQHDVRDFLTIGTGNGLDALAAAEIFPLSSLSATDLFPTSLEVSAANVRTNLVASEDLTLGFYSGDLFAGVPPARSFDLIYENLPNVPAAGELPLELGINSGRFYTPPVTAVPPLADQWLLALHWRCLQQAREFVRPGGGVLTAIGGRVPLEVASEIHRTAGFEPTLAAFDVKPQLEPELVLPGYRAHEQKRGSSFTFYRTAAVELLAAARARGLEGVALQAATEPALQRLAVSTAEAQVIVARGGTVAHSVLMLYGSRLATSRTA